MLKSIVSARRVVFHKRQWHKLLLLSCGHHALIHVAWRKSAVPGRLFDCPKCHGKVKNWRME